MATGFPVKANYATGDVLTAANMNDLSGTVNLIAPTAKGDLFAGSAANTYTKLAVGTNGQVLTADSTAATGLKWAATTSTPTFVGCALTKTAVQSTSNVTLTTVSWDSESFDTDGFHDNTTNNSRITIPSGKGGKYLFTTLIRWNSSSTGYREIRIMKNGTVQFYANFAATSSGEGCSVMSLVLNCSAADYFEIKAEQSSGGSLDILTASTFQATYLGA